MIFEVKKWPESQDVMDKSGWFFVTSDGRNDEYEIFGPSAMARILDESEYILVEKTTADEYNVQEEKDIKNDLYGTEEYVRISDINKEIARNWKKEEK